MTLVVALAPGFAPPVSGQEPQRPLVVQADPGSGTATLRIGDLLASRDIRGALEGGLPVRILVVTELWRDRFLGGQEGRAEWRLTILRDGLTGLYTIRRGDRGGDSREVASLEEVRSVLSDRLELPLRPPGPGRYYYQANLEVETLSLTDLEELQRWLRGELGPAVTGDESVEGAFNRGLRRAFIRLLGLPVFRYQTRSPSFRYPG